MKDVITGGDMNGCVEKNTVMIGTKILVSDRGRVDIDSYIKAAIVGLVIALLGRMLIFCLSL